MNYAALAPAIPELTLCAGAMLVLVADLWIPESARRHTADLALLVLGAVAASTFVYGQTGHIGEVFSSSAWTVYFRRLFLAGAALAVLGAREHVDRYARPRTGEYHALVLFSTVGMMLLPGVHDLLLFLVAFELMGIPLYVLATFQREGSGVPTERERAKRASEAGLKLYLVGAASTVLSIFGLSILVGLAGSTRFVDVNALPASPLVALGVVFLLAGMGFKIGAVPFHAWVPDTYQGAETPFVAFLSVTPKAAGIAAIVVLFRGAASTREAIWLPALVVLCVAAMTVGNLFALPQTNTRRLLGYSGIAQIGYMLLGIVAASTFGTAMTLFYLAGYLVTNMGAFFVLHAVAEADGGSDSLEDLAGLARRSPWLGMALLMFLLSLAGIPFVIGFWAKLSVFVAAYRAGLLGLVVAGAVLAVVGLFYYLQLARAAYMVAPRRTGTVAVTPGVRVAIVVCLLATVGMGLWPAPFVRAAERAAEAVGRGTP